MRMLPRLASCLLVALPVLLGAPVVDAEGTATVEEALAEARRLESARNEFQRARLKYEELLLPDRRATLTVEQLTKALKGAARCAKEEGKIERAVAHWEDIVGTAQLPEDTRQWAQRELDDYKRSRPPSNVTADETARRRAALMVERRKKAARLVEAAKRARDRGHFEQALVKVFEAMALDPNYEPAFDERARILAERPDRATILESLLRIVETQELTDHRNLSRTVHRLREEGKAAGDAGDYDAADRLLRDAIVRIDESGFLETGGPFLEIRREVAAWLGQVHERAAKEGKSYRDIPDLPGLNERKPRFQGQLLALLAKWLRPVDTRESLRFYRFGRGRRSPHLPLLGSQIKDARVTLARSSLSRARWAERRVRSSIGTNWTNPLDRDAEPRKGKREPRILARFGDLLAVQHRDDVLRRIEALRSAFATETPPALNVDVHVFAAAPAGVVRAMETLALRATGTSLGETLIHRDLLIEKCLDKLEDVPGLTPLGSAQIGLHETSSTEVGITQLTSDFPVFQRLGPPPVVVPTERSTYGLWLDLYAEDLPNAESGWPRSAVSLVARTRMPTHAPIVPRRAAPDMPHTRIPQLGEHRREIDIELPHHGTLVVLGLPNPLVPSNATAQELVILMSVRRKDDIAPDPSNKTDERILPDPYSQRQYELGALATEVFDHLIGETWPEIASANVLSSDERMLDRNDYLASVLVKLARLEKEDRDALSVADGRCAATLTKEQHVRVDRATRALRAHEADLYRVEANWQELSSADWTRWVASPGVTSAGPGVFRVAPGTETPLDEIEDVGRLFAGSDSMLARATQRVGIRRLQERTIVRDIRIVPMDDGVRLVPEVAPVHQGVVIEARPGLDREGVRSVQIRVRSARWEGIERRAHPGTDAAGIEVPVWKRSQGDALADRVVSEIVGDDDVIVLGLPVPGDAARILGVRIQVRKIQ